MVTPEELFEYAVSSVVPPFLLRPQHVHIKSASPSSMCLSVIYFSPPGGLR
jgi:hypothetical protein